MTDARNLTPDDRASLAGEFVLGLLDGEEQELARSLLVTDGAFRLDVARWSGRLSPLLDEVDEVRPPEPLWGRISERISEPLRPSAEIHQLRRKVTVWRGVSGAAMAMAASLALFLVIQPRTVAPPAPVPVRERPAAPLVAKIGTEDAPMAMVATWDSANRRLMVAAAAATPAGPEHSHELWVIPTDGTPRSLGIMPDQPTKRMAIGEPVARQIHEGATLAVSLEPRGGSTTGLPTGPVIASGKLESA